MTESTFAGCGPVGAFDFVPFHAVASYAAISQPDMSNWCSPALTKDALAEWLQWALGRHAGKQVARIFGKSLRTAKFWLSGGIPESAYPMVAREILAELDRQEAKARLIRRHLEKIAGIQHGVGAAALPRQGAGRRQD